MLRFVYRGLANPENENVNVKVKVVNSKEKTT
jgi:hypothetical protein